jgi:endonuclease/exonuclease/phosphatase family metal-dependent hydrolase
MDIMSEEFRGHLCFGSFHRNPAAGGIIQLISLRLLCCPQAPRLHVIDPGRCIVVTIYTELQPITFVNLHLPPIYEATRKKHIFHRIRDYLSSSPSLVFLLGDFNFITSEEHRFDPQAVTHVSADHALSLHFDAVLDQFCELHQGDFTRKRIRDGRITRMSRLDRIYTNMPTAHLLELRPQKRVFALLTDPEFPSDHVPVISVLAAPRTSPPARPRIKPDGKTSDLQAAPLTCYS